MENFLISGEILGLQKGMCYVDLVTFTAALQCPLNWMVTLVVTQIIAYARQKKKKHGRDYARTYKRRFFPLTADLHLRSRACLKTTLSSTAGREIAIFRKVIFHHKLERRAQYVIYSV